jgi:hypothetical protein
MSALLQNLGLTSDLVESREENEDIPPLTQREYMEEFRKRQPAPQPSTPHERPSREQGGALGRIDAQIPDTLSEFASAANRATLEGVDFLTTGPVNSVLSLAGREERVPTLAGRAQDVLGIGQPGFMEQGPLRSVTQAGGSLVPAAASMVSVPRQAGTTVNTVLDVVGAGSSSLTAPVRNTTPYFQGMYESIVPPNPLTAARRKQVEIPLKRRTGAADTFGFKLDDQNQVVRTKAHDRARKQGLKESVVTMVQSAPPKAREKFATMLDIIEQGRLNERFAGTNSPSDVVGESIANRLAVIIDANRAAGGRLDEVASTLRGQSVDVAPAIDGFLSDLKDMGIAFDPQSGFVEFDGSIIEGLEGPQNAIARMIRRLRNTQAPDAYDVHRMKRWIDENVTYGKNAEGLAGSAEGVVKALRHRLDTALDEYFPAYNKVNTEYATTRRAIDSMQSVAGKRVDLTGDYAETALGDLSRRVLGRAVSRQQLLRALDEVDNVAREVVSGGGTEVAPYRNAVNRSGRVVTTDDLDDDIIGQVIFVSQLEEVFGTSRGNSLLGEMQKAGGRMTDNLVQSGRPNVVGEMSRAALNRVRGINEENAIKAFRELLEDSR